MAARPRANDDSVIVPAEGVTTGERYLARLCKRSFLAMWSYPGVYRDQGQHAHKGDGKEVCDLLVVFENHVLIFSDKDCELIGGEHIRENWARWFRKAVQNSAKQVWGAERWIKSFPNRLFLDRQCKIPFPLNLPDPSNAIFHRIVVAHGASRACREQLGGSGSLMLNSRLIGDAHFNEPFTIGQLDPDKGYIHIFDDTTLTILLETLDTITDFTAYLTKKERLLTGCMGVIAAGEEIATRPYVWGGGHGSFQSAGYDCSGSVSYALHGGNLLNTQLDSTQLESWGDPGPGSWITIYANSGHTFMTVAGLRFDTSGLSQDGSRWHVSSHPTSGYVVRHPTGL